VRPFREVVVGSLVPHGFAAYGRVFHPAYDGGLEVRWAQVARANRRQAHPAMEWGSITGSWRFLEGKVQPGVWDQMPSMGSLPVRQAARLAELLAAHTATPQRCWFAVWEGFANLAVPVDGTPRLAMPQRPMVVLRGALSAAPTSLAPYPADQRASLWWPEDHSWCVATDVDLLTTYVGASQECTAAVVAADDMEAMVVPVDQRVSWDSDTLNPPPSDSPQWRHSTRRAIDRQPAISPKPLLLFARSSNVIHVDAECCSPEEQQRA
jgi:hypothetical protein